MTVPAQGTTRVRVQDVKPYDAPMSLDDLRGPRDGELVLPHHIHWGPRREVNLSREGDVLTAYRATISEGMVADPRLVKSFCTASRQRARQGRS